MTAGVVTALAGMAERDTPAISAVIRTLNSAATLPATLDSLAAQSLPAREVVVVDSGSEDSTVEIARRYGARVAKYPEGCEFNYAKALNMGIECVSGAYILSISSHVVLVNPHALEAMFENLRLHGGAACSCVHRYNLEDSRKDLLEQHLRLVEVNYADNFDGYNGMWNSCSLFPKALWEAHPFDETIPAAEDQAWAAWQYANSKRPTVLIRNAGVAYLNPHKTSWKKIRDHVVIAERLVPHLRSWRSICLHLFNGSWDALFGPRHSAKTEFWTASALIRSRVAPGRLKSKYW